MIRAMSKRAVAAWAVGAMLLAGIATAAEPPEVLSVDEAVRIALDQNYSFRQAEAGVSAAAGSRLDSFAGLLPSASGSYSYSKDNSTRTAKDIAILTNPRTNEVLQRGDLALDSESSSNRLGFSLREDLSLPIWFGYKSSRAQLESARYGLAASAQELAYGVRQQFYLVLRAQELLTVQEEDLRLANDEERRINSMYELGSVAKVDVLKARVRVSEADLALIQQKNAVAIETSRLATLLGYSPDTRLNLEGNLRSAPAPVDSAAAAAESLERPDLEQARADLRSASHQAKAAVLSRLPGLFASFNWNTSTGTSRSDNVVPVDLPGVPAPGDTAQRLITYPFDSDSESDGWSFQVGASVSLDAFLNMGQHKRARALQRQAEYRLDDQLLAAQQELEESILNYRASVQAIESAQRGLESAEEDLRLSEERYEQGLGTVLELLEAQVNLTRARYNLVTALTGLKIAEAAVDKARGAPLPR